jgi:hypothetical protein
MAANVGNLLRETDSQGDPVKVFKDAAARSVQTVVADPEVGADMWTYAATGNASVSQVVISAVPAFLRSVRLVANPAGLTGDRYLHVYNAIAVVAPGAIPTARAQIALNDPAGAVGISGEALLDLEVPLRFSTGIVVAVSTTAGDFTAPPAGGWFHTLYRPA